MPKRAKLVIGVHLILRRKGEVLLSRRKNTGFRDGSYNFPCGHMDEGETVIAALIREMREELGIGILKKDLHFAGVTHWDYKDNKSVNLYFECRKWKGTPENREPDQCDHVAWFGEKHLPRKLVPQTKAVLRRVAAEQTPFFIE